MTVGDKVTALIYSRNQEWLPGVIINETNYPYRPGFIVRLDDNSEHWVLEKDIKERVCENDN